MQTEFVIPVISKDGRTVNMEVKQKNHQVTKRKVKTWTNEEDNQLLELYQKFPKKWAEIAALMNDRNENQCLHRYRRLSQLGKNHKIWSSEEDETIKKLIKKYGKNWKLLSEMLGSKNGKQIRERFINKLDPRIKKEDWSEEEDHKILELYSKIGSKWS
jgi:myb proto-oncogene protein